MLCACNTALTVDFVTHTVKSCAFFFLITEKNGKAWGALKFALMGYVLRYHAHAYYASRRKKGKGEKQ